jgi:hypothetical protein
MDDNELLPQETPVRQPRRLAWAGLAVTCVFLTGALFYCIAAADRLYFLSPVERAAVEAVRQTPQARVMVIGLHPRPPFLGQPGAYEGRVMRRGDVWNARFGTSPDVDACWQRMLAAPRK